MTGLDRETQITWNHMTPLPDLTTYLLNKLEKPLVNANVLHKHLRLTVTKQKDHPAIDPKALVAESGDPQSNVRLLKKQRLLDSKFLVVAQVVIGHKQLFCRAYGGDFHTAVDKLEAKLKRIIGDWHHTYTSHEGVSVADKFAPGAASFEVTQADLVTETREQIAKANLEDEQTAMESALPKVQSIHFFTENYPQTSMEDALLHMADSHDPIFFFLNLDDPQMRKTALVRLADDNCIQVNFLEPA